MSDFNPQQFHDDLTDDIHRRMRRRRDRFHRRRHSPVGGVIIGTAILLAGVLFLLENFGLLHIHNLWAYWPVIMMAWGIAALTGAGHGGRRVWGGVIAVVGTLLLLSNLHIITASVWRMVWPLLLILAGLRMLYRNARRRGRRDDDHFPPTGGTPGAPEGTAPPSGAPGNGRPGHLDEWAVFGGSRRRVDSQDFKGGEAFAMFGGVELDLRSAAIVQEEVVIDASALFGGVDLQVPENWNVSVEGHGIFGGYEDKTVHAMADNARPRVVITGSAVFGGVVVKN